MTSSAGEVRKTDLIELTREGRVKELSFFSHDLPFYTRGCLMAQRKGGRVNHAGSLAITICDPGF